MEIEKVENWKQINWPSKLSVLNYFEMFAPLDNLRKATLNNKHNSEHSFKILPFKTSGLRNKNDSYNFHLYFLI